MTIKMMKINKIIRIYASKIRRNSFKKSYQTVNNFELFKDI